jgi:hypothetical protein
MLRESAAAVDGPPIVAGQTQVAARVTLTATLK